MTDTLYTIPQNWRWTTLENIAEIIMGQSPSGNETTNDSNYTPLIGGAADMGNLFPSATRYTKKPTKLSKKDDVIICVRATIGRAIFSNGEYCLGRGVAAIRPRLVLKRFIRYALINFEQYLFDNATGSTFLQISSDKLKNFPIPLPPLAEQKRIVERLDSLFEKLDTAKKILQDIVDDYEQRRAAILHRAFTSKLTEDFRKKNNLSLDDWQEKTLGELLLPMETKRPTGEFFRYIDIESIDNRQQVVRSPKIIETANAPSRASRAVDFDNILFSMVRPYLKNIALIDEKLKDCIASTGFFVCRCNEKIFPQFLYNFLCSEEAINYLMQFMKGDNSPSIRQDDFKSLPLNLPTLEEQKEIARRLDSLLGKENQAKEIAEKLLSEIEKLKKTILSRAFRGELGTNDPSENAVENFEIERE